MPVPDDAPQNFDAQFSAEEQIQSPEKRNSIMELKLAQLIALQAVLTNDLEQCQATIKQHQERIKQREVHAAGVNQQTSKVSVIANKVDLWSSWWTKGPFC